MINTVGNEAMGELAENTRLALDEAADETKQAQPRGGLMAMVSMLSKPETQQQLRLPAVLRREAAEADVAGLTTTHLLLSSGWRASASPGPMHTAVTRGA